MCMCMFSMLCGVFLKRIRCSESFNWEVILLNI